MLPEEVDDGPEVSELANVDEERRNERRQQVKYFKRKIIIHRKLIKAL